MKHLYRYCLGFLFLGVFVTNGVNYLWKYPDNHPINGVIIMASWMLMWIFLATQGSSTLSERDKFYGAFTLGVASAYLLYHLIYGNLVPPDASATLLFVAVLSFGAAVTVGLWWSEVSPP